MLCNDADHRRAERGGRAAAESGDRRPGAERQTDHRRSTGVGSSARRPPRRRETDKPPEICRYMQLALPDGRPGPERQTNHRRSTGVGSSARRPGPERLTDHRRSAGTCTMQLCQTARPREADRPPEIYRCRQLCQTARPREADRPPEICRHMQLCQTAAQAPRELGIATNRAAHRPGRPRRCRRYGTAMETEPLQYTWQCYGNCPATCPRRYPRPLSTYLYGIGE